MLGYRALSREWNPESPHICDPLAPKKYVGLDMPETAHV
jgi:hypothetical protein